MPGELQVPAIPRVVIMTSDEIARMLNRLIATCKDGEAGFQAAWEAVLRSSYSLARDHDGASHLPISAEQLKHLFASCSRQRAAFAEDLQQLVELYTSDDPQEETTLAGALHRGIINFHASLGMQGGIEAILMECERGEERALRQYEEAMERDLPPDVRPVVQSQYRCIQETCAQIRELRLAIAAAGERT